MKFFYSFIAFIRQLKQTAMKFFYSFIAFIRQLKQTAMKFFYSFIAFIRQLKQTAMKFQRLFADCEGTITVRLRDEEGRQVLQCGKV
jgi:hypothetical protein